MCRYCTRSCFVGSGRSVTRMATEPLRVRQTTDCLQIFKTKWALRDFVSYMETCVSHVFRWAPSISRSITLKTPTISRHVMLGRKPTLKEGTHVFSTKPNGEYNDFIIGVVTGIDGRQVGINGIKVDMVGLKNKVTQGKAGQRSVEILANPTPDNAILGLVYRIEHDNYTAILDLDRDRCDIIPPKVYATIDGWIRESLSELFNKVLSLPPGEEREEAKRMLRHRKDTLLDKNLKRTVYSVCRSLKILT